MPYDTSPKLPEIRMKAVLLLRKGWSTRKVSRHTGFSQSAIVKWSKRAPRDGRMTIETRSSRPHRSPSAIPKDMVAKIVAKRSETQRCAEVVHAYLKNDDVTVSVSTVKRTLDRYGMTEKRSRWKKTRKYPPRPDIRKEGDIVEVDTIHFVDGYGKRTYVYTAIDVYSRYGFAATSGKAACGESASFLRKAMAHFPFKISCIQTDNGPEFGLSFNGFVKRKGMVHRHIHVRSPNENGHLERFNRTIQEEMPRHGLCIFLDSHISKYLKKYNTERLHMGIGFKTPAQMLN